MLGERGGGEEERCMGWGRVEEGGKKGNGRISLFFIQRIILR